MNTIYWCRGCGLEDTRVQGACPTCGAALSTSNLEWLNEGDMGAETVYEVEVTSVQRAGLVEALITDEVRHRWDSLNELVVPSSEEEAVDTIFDDVLHEEVEVVDSGDGVLVADEIIDADVDEDDLSPDPSYEAMSTLYFSADRLIKHWEDGEPGTYIADANALIMLDAPLGMEDEPWADLQSVARNSAAALQEDAAADVRDEVVAVRDTLKALI